MRKSLKRLFAGLALSLSTAMVQAAIEPHSFSSPQEEKRYHALIAELRCLVCQNQSLADSNADLATDLRNLVYQKMREGKTNQEIIDFLVARYSDFVLYRPPVKSTTIMLWFAPALLIIIGATVAFIAIRRRGQQIEAPLTVEEHKKVEQLLAEKDKTGS